MLKITDISLPSDEDFDKLPRHLKIGYSPWWIKLVNKHYRCAAYVNNSGYIHYTRDYKYKLSVRPILKFRTNGTPAKMGDRFMFNGYVFEIYSISRAICVGALDNTYYSHILFCVNPWNYKGSHVEKYLKHWLSKATNRKKNIYVDTVI